MSKAKGKDAKKEPDPVPEVVLPKIETGRFNFPDGSSYEGEFENRDNLKVRQGKGTYTNGPESYVGNWENDAMSGEGIYKFSSGAVYTGGFLNGMFHGEGRYQYLDGAFYQGSWNANKMHGRGVYVDSDNIRWEGTFFNGLFDSGKSYVSIRPSNGV